MKTKSLLSNIIVVVMTLVAAQPSYTQEGCVDPVDLGPCHTASSSVLPTTCQVSTDCPYGSSINNATFNTWKITIFSTDSLTSNWGCTSGSTYKNSQTSNPNNCYWSVQQVDCPCYQKGCPCYPTLTYVTAGPGSRTTLRDLTGC